MIEPTTYCVAGLSFTLEGGFSIPRNLLPFPQQAGKPENLLFTLTRAESLPEEAQIPLFTTDDGPGFPEIAIAHVPGGYRFTLKPLPGHPVAGILRCSEDFSEASLLPLDDAGDFALNNALMLLYAFASASHGALEMHSSVVMQDGKGYLFLGRSGTGKSTHSSLWLRHIPGTELLNDDNPILRLMPDGSVRVFSSPWSGKTPCYKAQDVPAAAIVRIRQAPKNHIERLDPVQAYATVMASASGFRPFKPLADEWHRTLEGVVSRVPCFTLDCLPDQAAAELCYHSVHG